MSCIEVCGEQMLGSATFVDGLDGASRLVGGASCSGTISRLLPR